ncbi:MAG: hypothetical protein WKF70_02110 [Chitinophagaceae bacterium]
MLYLLWGLINLALVIFFIGLCLGATKLIKERFGIFACIVFVFGLLSFAGGSNDNNDYDDHESLKLRKWNFTPEQRVSQNTPVFQYTNLEETLFSKYLLGISYATMKTDQSIVPISASSLTTGLTMGTVWKPISIDINSTRNNSQLEYVVNGVLKWKLLGATIYTQSKEYKGTAMMTAVRQ